MHLQTACSERQIQNKTAFAQGVEGVLSNPAINPQSQKGADTHGDMSHDLCCRLLRAKWDLSLMVTFLMFLQRHGTDLRCPFRVFCGHPTGPAR